MVMPFGVGQNGERLVVVWSAAVRFLDEAYAGVSSPRVHGI